MAAEGVTKLRSWDFYRKLGSPRFLVAPMVEQSELAWRVLCRSRGADLCYTPMINSGAFLRDPNPKGWFETAPEDRPLIAQFCGNDPDVVLEAARRVEDRVDGVDLNLGCPQNIARRGHYGSFLMEEWDLISSIISKLHKELKVPVTCKIRVFPELEKTVEYAKMLEASGAQMITVHGRLRTQKGPLTFFADWDKIKAVKQALKIPVFANGNILYSSDIKHCMEYTGVDGVMVSETNLENPSIFEYKFPVIWNTVNEYLALAVKYNTQFSHAKAHLFRMWHAVLRKDLDLRERLVHSHTIQDLLDAAKICEERLKEEFKDVGEFKDIIEEPLPIASHKAGFEYLQLPLWVCQPCPRNHDQDRETLANTNGKRPGEGAEGTADGATAAPATTTLEDGTVVPAAQPAEPAKPKKAKKEKPFKEVKGRAKFPVCSKCNNNPKGTKCTFGMCRTCCHDHAFAVLENCESHKYWAKNKHEKKLADDAAAAAAAATADGDATSTAPAEAMDTTAASEVAK